MSTVVARNTSTEVRRIDGPIRIGHERIYPTQCRLGRKVMDRLRLNELPTTEVTLTPMMVLQQQEGKTGGMIYVINAFVADCVKRFFASTECIFPSRRTLGIEVCSTML